MKTFFKRCLTMLLAAAMVFGLSGMTAFAAEANEQDAQALAAREEIATLDSSVDYKQYDLDFTWYTNPNAESFSINSREQLAALSAIVNDTDLPDGIRQNSFANQTINLESNLVMNNSYDVQCVDGEWGGIATPVLTISEDAYAFTPIGNMRFNSDGSRASGYSFQGTFNGNGHRIDNLFVTGNEGYVGLFGVVGGLGTDEEGQGTLENFTISGVIECDGGDYNNNVEFAGGACAKLNAGSIVKYVTNEATIVAPYTDVTGGIVGFAGTPNEINDTVTTNPGYSDNPSGYNTYVVCCANKGTVLGFHNCGGIVGENAATVMYCYNTGWIMSRKNYSPVNVGGVVGSNGNNGNAAEESIIAYCYNTGQITNAGCDDRQVHSDTGVMGYAGVSGCNYGGAGKNEVYNCYNVGTIPKGYSRYNSLASQLDATDSYGYGAYVAIRNNYSLVADDINRGMGTYPQETGIWTEKEDFLNTGYGDDDILTCLGPYFVADTHGIHNKYPGFPILWWQDEEASLPTAVTGLTIAQEPYTTFYRDGDVFDPNGMVIIAEYDNGTRALLLPIFGSYASHEYYLTFGYSYDTDYLSPSDRFEEITYTEGDTTLTAWQPINGGITIDDIALTSSVDGNSKSYDGSGFTLTADVTVTPADAELTYQWYKDGVEIGEASTSNQLSVSGNVSDGGTYTCVVIGSMHDTESAPASADITIRITKGEQDVSFAEPELTYMVGDGSFTNQLNGVASGASVTYESSAPGVATVDENTGEVTVHAAGAATITAYVSDTENYEAATAQFELTVINPEAPDVTEVTITSNMDGNGKVYDGGEVTLTADAQIWPPSANVTYQWYLVGEDQSETPLGEASSDNQLVLKGNVSDSGTYKCVVSAWNSEGDAQAEGDITIEITKAVQSVSFAETEMTKMEGDKAFTNPLSGAADGAIVTYESSNPGVATVDEKTGEVTVHAAGDATITAYVSDTENYVAATAQYELTVEPARLAVISDVTITSTPDDSSKTYDGEGFRLTVSATVDLEEVEVTYQWYKDGKEVEGATDTVLDLDGDVADSGTYTCVVTATNIAGSAHGEAEITITIEKAAQKISFEKPEITKAVGDGSFTNEVNATIDTAGGAAVNYTSSDERVATVNGETGEVTIVGAGEATITAAVSSTANYAEASDSFTLTVVPAVRGVTITSTMDDDAKTYDGVGVSLTARADVDPAEAEVTWQWYKDDAPIEGVTGNVLNLAGDVSDSGTYRCVVTASANGMQSEPASGEITITIAKAAQELSFAAPEIHKTVGDEPFANELNATIDTAGGAVITYTSTNADVATVDENGRVTILAEGDTTITATASATANYAEAAASYALTVEAAQALPAVDKTELEAAIAAAEDLTASDYTEDSWAAVEEALAAAWIVEENGEATQGEVDSAKDALVEAIAKLQPADGQTPETDKTALLNEYREDTEFIEGDYTEQSWALFARAMTNAQEVLLNTEATQYEIDQALHELQTARENLVPVVEQPAAVDKEVLKAAIADAKDLNESDYTEDSWNALQTALAPAVEVYEDENATQSQVKSAEIELIRAIANLKFVDEEQPGTVTDKSELLEVYIEAMNLSENDYTPESWAPFEDALAEALNVLLDTHATQEAVGTAADALQTAMDALEPAGRHATGGEPKNGLYMIEKGVRWGYYVNDVVDTGFTGFVHNQYGDWYVENGYVIFADPSEQGVFKDTAGAIGAKGTWYYVTGGEVQHGFTGLAHYRNQYGWWYITKGEVDFTHNGVDKNQNGWWYVKNGKVEFGHNGVDKNRYGWWYITGGKVRFDFTGLSNYRNQYGWWYINGGKVDFSHSGVEKNKNGWWYVHDGKVDFNFTGIASNRYGTWYINSGKVRFDYNGTVTAGGTTYTVRNGKVG